MDNDLAASVAELKESFSQRGVAATFGQADATVVDELRKTLHLPPRFQAFLQEADPVDVETVTPVERVRLIASDKLAAEQPGSGAEDSAASAWRKSWIMIGRSAELGDPYFLDISKLDDNGDCPVFVTAEGADSTTQPTLCASSVVQFLRILAASMEVASDFSGGEDDEAIFREALSPKIKTIDSAALRGSHWT
ncbi:hypothetical protein ABTX77_36000 [Streptomyces sp. NPDC097704]|uniref:hypothetical protein n=1 Tax=Streptomyces sp. NPDC097704 TaxID=3157101 RepID=UPI0033241490